MSKSDLEAHLLRDIHAVGLPEPEREYKFHPERGWLFDFAYPEMLLAIEVNGGIWRKGAHSSGKGLERDYEKLNEAQLLGWVVLQFSSGMISDGSAVSTIERAVKMAQEATI